MVQSASFDTRNGNTVWAGVTSMHWGPTVARSKDFGANWFRPAEGPKFPKGTDLSVSKIWQVVPGAGTRDVFAGAEPAGLFRSNDEGETWESVDGLNLRKERGEWPPGGGGLCLHTILPYPGEPKRMIAAISSAGVFGTNDAGATWRLMNNAISNPFSEAKMTAEDEVGTCPHKIVRDAKNPAILYMQNHWGQYTRKRGDEKWTDIGQGLPSTFGFPMAAHPSKAGVVYVLPLEGDFNRVTKDGAVAVYRRQPNGKGWDKLTKGLPQSGAYLTILRDGMATDQHDPAGVYFGTQQGQVYGSRDDGETWSLIAQNLPPIMSVSAAVAR